MKKLLYTIGLSLILTSSASARLADSVAQEVCFKPAFPKPLTSEQVKEWEYANSLVGQYITHTAQNNNCNTIKVRFIKDENIRNGVAVCLRMEDKKNGVGCSHSLTAEGRIRLVKNMNNKAAFLLYEGPIKR